MTFCLLDIHNWEETGWASLYSSAGRTSNGNWPMDHWVSVLSFLTLAELGKDLLILFRDCDFFGGRFWILDFLSRRLPFQVNMEGLGHQEGTVNPSQDGSVTPGFTHFWALYLLPPARTLMADQRSDSMQVSSCMVNSKEHGQLSGMLYHGKAHSSMGDDLYIRAVSWATLESPRAPNSLLLICSLFTLATLLGFLSFIRVLA